MRELLIFKEGDKVIFRPNMDIRLAHAYQEFHSCQPNFTDGIEELCRNGTVGTVEQAFPDGDKYYVEFEDNNWTCIPQWLLPAEEGMTVSVEDLQKIEKIACEAWKRRIRNMVPHPSWDKVFVRRSMIDKMVSAATDSQLPIVQEVFSKILGDGRGVGFKFPEKFELNTVSTPIYIRRGHASKPCYADCELGFTGSKGRVVLVHKGEEIQLELGSSGSYLRFYEK